MTWTVDWARSPRGVPALFVLSAAESVFFPVPPDLLLAALVLAAPARAFRFAVWCTAGSVTGAALSYGLGWGLWEALAPWVLDRLVPAASFDAVAALYRDHGAMAVFTAAVTPLPFKVFTLAAGVTGVGLPGFLLASAVGRGARFALVAAFVRGARAGADDPLGRRLRWASAAIAAAVLIAYGLSGLLGVPAPGGGATPGPS